jgi:protein tyrosine/serine phosphatase
LTLKARQLLLGALAIVIVPLLGIGAYLGYLQLTGNFHVALAGQLYRSAQPTAAQIDRYAEAYGIRTVLNLRGAHAKAGWYRDEIDESQRLGLHHVDFRMSASKELSATDLAKLVAILRQSPKPILVHCQSGADRSGLVAAIFLRDIAGVDAATAAGQISLIYGHIGIPYLSSTYAMDRTWDKLQHGGLVEPKVPTQ